MFRDRHLKAVVFDYGNTLIQFTRPQIEHCNRALAEALSEMFGPPDFEKLAAARHRDRLEPYRDGYEENDLPFITRRLVRELYKTDATDAQLEHLLEVRFSSFVDSIAPPPAAVVQMLTDLRGRYRIGLLSNYPCGRAIRASLDRVGLTDHLDAIVVSGDVGHVKPHPAPFQKVLAALDTDPADAVYIGDNWLGDIQGAKRIGMAAVFLQEHEVAEHFDRADGHHDADLTIERVVDLAAHL